MSPVGESPRLVVGLASISGLNSSWLQAAVPGASKGAAKIGAPDCQVVASIVVISGPLQEVGFESSGL